MSEADDNDTIKSQVLDLIQQDIKACDCLVGLFWCALSSYRHDTVLRPYPAQYTLSDGTKDINGLKATVDAIPSLNKIQSCLDSVDMSTFQLLHWILNTKSFSLQSKPLSQFPSIKEQTPGSTHFTTPTFLFELIYSSEQEEKWNKILGDYGTFMAYHGSRMENFHCICHFGLISHMNKVGIYGDGTYLSTDLGVCTNFSPSGNTWPNGLLPPLSSMMAVCEVVSHPEVRSRIQIGGEPSLTQKIPDKYFVVTNNELIRVKYILVFAHERAQPRSAQNWLYRHKWSLLVLVYVFILLIVGLSQSRYVSNLYYQYSKEYCSHWSGDNWWPGAVHYHDTPPPEYDIHKHIFQQLYSATYYHVNENHADAENSDIVLRKNGHFLHPDEFKIPKIYENATIIKVRTTKKLKINQTSIPTISHRYIPARIMQNMFDLSNVVPNMSHWIGNPEDGSVDFSSAYIDIINKLLDHSRKQGLQALHNVRSYLAEPVQDPEPQLSQQYELYSHAGLNATRLTLYHRYKSIYYHTQMQIKDNINSRKKWMTGTNFKHWYKKHKKDFSAMKKEQLQKWYRLGHKTDVENRMKNILPFQQVHNIDSAKRLLEGYRQPSWDQFYDPTWEKSKSFIYRVNFIPSNWYKLLSQPFNESSLQFEFRINRTKRQIEKFKNQQKGLKSYLTSNAFQAQLQQLRDQYYDSKRRLMIAVFKFREISFLCRATGNQSICNNVTRLKHVLNELQINHTTFHWMYNKLRSRHPSHESYDLKEIKKSLNDSKNLLSSLNILYNQSKLEVPLKYDNTSSDMLSYDFYFNPINATQTIKEINDFDLPKSIKKRRLWYLNQNNVQAKANKTTEKYLYTLESYLNNLAENITVSATVSEVVIERSWFNHTLFRTLMKLSKLNFSVSPGPQSTPAKFRDAISSGQYMLPAFPLSLLVATNIKLTFPHLPPDIKNRLIALSYEPLVKGGYGPFSFGRMYGGKKGTASKQIVFRLDENEEELILTIPGLQVIGYVCHIIAKFPNS